jgi:uncharacterized protein (TIGR03382 family)
MPIMRSAAFAFAFTFVGVTGTASAHFRLNEPTPTLQQAANGDPQKDAPCGGAGTATNAVTDYQSGGTLTVKLAETITHPGHYRIAIAANEASLPPPPTVTGPNCAAAAIMSPPVMPILADGLFPNITPADGEQTVQIQLPADYTCSNCILQVIEFMSITNGSCFYYHCAAVNITAAGPPPGDAGVNPTSDADNGNGNGGGNSGGEISGGCSTGHTTSLGALVLLGLIGLLRRRH